MSQKGDTSHARWRTLLEQHLDGELDAPGRQLLFAHLEECESCRETLEAEERLVDKLSRLPRIAAPSDLRAAILKEVARERAEALQPLTEDDRYAELFAAPDPPRSRASRGNAPAPTLPHRPARPRTLWRRATPSLAISFLIVVATLNVLYRHGGSFMNWRPSSTAVAEITPANVPVRLAPADSNGPEPILHQPPARLPRMDEISYASFATSDSGILLPVRRGVEQVRNSLTKLATVAAVPSPAEQERPISQILLLRLQASQNSGQHTKLATLVEDTLENSPGAQIRVFQQWESEGKRYRSLTVDLAEEECETLLGALHDSCAAPLPESVPVALPPGEVQSIPRMEPVIFSGRLEQFAKAFKSRVVGHAPGAKTRRLCFVLPSEP